jgi:hypothetical protein
MVTEGRDATVAAAVLMLPGGAPLADSSQKGRSPLMVTRWMTLWAVP